MFSRACHGSVSKSVSTVCQKEIIGRKAWSPVSFYAFPELRVQVGSAFPCYASSVFTGARIRLLWNTSAKRIKFVFIEGRVEKSKVNLLIV